jgi:hypothetical protein
LGQRASLSNMCMSVRYHGSGSRLRVTVLCVGAFALLYGGSFYTRDWRTAVPHGARPVEQAAVRSARLAASLVTVAKVDEPPPSAGVARAEPDVTGALASRLELAEDRPKRPSRQRAPQKRTPPQKETAGATPNMAGASAEPALPLARPRATVARFGFFSRPRKAGSHPAPAHGGARSEGFEDG